MHHNAHLIQHIQPKRLITGEPFIYVMEDFWKPLQDPLFADFIFNKQKTIRKQSGLGAL
jgi:type IV secretion system protein VirB4